ncbi:MAG: CLC_0170 family protein [Clostridium sp.]
MSYKIIIQSMFGFDSLVVFLLCACILLFIDCKDYKKRNMVKEYKAAKAFSLLFIFGGTGMYIFAMYFIK